MRESYRVSAPTEPRTWLDLYATRADQDLAAVVTSDGVLTSRELTACASSASDWLDERGASAGRPVAALVSTTTDAFALALAGAASRRALAPLGTRLTPTELGRILRSLDPAVLVTEADAVDLAHAAAEGLDIAVHQHPRFEPSDRALDLGGVGPDDVAVILHTSGTSGEPKQVPYLQGRLLLRTRVNAAAVRLGPGAVYATASPFHHIAGLGMLCVALGSGAALSPLSRFTADTWSEVIGRGTTHALLVPSMIEQLLDENRLVRGELRCLQYGASRIDPGTLRRLLEALPGIDLVQIYGQTEGSPIAILTPGDHRRAAAEGGDTSLLSSAGGAAAGVELTVHEPDESGAGELWARADHLMKPDADGWLRTGDLARMDADGYVTIVGRKGDMIVRGGENVYPEEVEEVIRRHPGVADVAVVGLPDQRLGQVVVAFVVARDPAEPPTPESLREHAREVLAGFKVPQQWKFLAELPRNQTGKVLRRRLVDS